MGSNGNDHDYIQCGCHNPVWEALKHSLDPARYMAGLPRENHGPLQEPDGASIVFTNGILYPLREGNMDDRVEALGIHAGDVVAVGTLAEVKARMQDLNITYAIQDLGGRTLLPGLVEPHAHIVQSCAMDGWLNLGAIVNDVDTDPDSKAFNHDEQQNQRLRPVYDWNWLKSTIQAQLPKDDSTWILGHMVDPALMPFTVVPGGENQLITLGCGFDEEVGNLDSIDKLHPMLLVSASMHTAYLNSAASELVAKAGIPVDNGTVQEEDVFKAILVIPLKQQLEMLTIFKRLDHYFATAARRGITLLYDAMMDPISRLLLDAYFLNHPRTLRIGYAAACNGTTKSINQLPTYQAATREQAKRMYQGSVKLVSDGSNQGLTGYQATDYCCNAGARPKGNFNFCDEGDQDPQDLPVAYQDLVQAVAAKGWPLMIHANGDRAIDFTLQAYQKAFEQGVGLNKRHRIEHCSLLSEDRLKTMVKLGLSPSFLVGHVGYWGYAFQQAIFENRADTMLDLCQMALGKDLRISLHSDCTVTPLGPLRSMEQAVTRKMEGLRLPGQIPYVQDPQQLPVLNAQECLTRKQALKAITYDAAWQCNAEAWTGSLAVGNFADLVILEQDPLDENVPATSIRDIKVHETWKGGQRVYSSSAN
ncbi:MAG: amidohydrolase [Pseudomonas sp.]|uniref:amidohydrolase n=1 Tax=unclassified Pseudomonas TaxID=196821 RepID=UPI001CFB3B09|nr:amidohydrolase family protein [Pseudomonas sp. L5B5]UCZ84360.1 amidohydrolase family protein [Pseudomonas sp. L5B5]